MYLGFDQTIQPLWLHDHLGANVAMIGLVYVVWAIPNIILSPLGGRMADRRQRSLLILIFGLAQVPIYIGYGLTNMVIVVLVLSVIHGVIYAFIQPALDSQVAASSARDARAQVQGFYAAIGSIGAFVGASGFTPLYAINFRLPLFAMGTLFGICVLIGGLLIRMDEKRKLQVVTEVDNALPAQISRKRFFGSDKQNQGVASMEEQKILTSSPLATLKNKRPSNLLLANRPYLL